MIMYIVQVSVALVLFYIGYALCLRQQTNFALLRSYLLFSIGASVITPFINFRAIAATFVNVTPQPAFEATWLPEVTVTAIQTTTRENPDWIWTTINTVYWAGAVVSAIFLLISILKLRRIIASVKPKQDGASRYYLLPDSPHSFSFFRYIFLGKDANDSSQQTILTHERAHARLGHSFDVMFVRMVAILVWFNPVIYWFKHKLEEVHEFQADASTVQPETANTYCELLVRETLEANHISLANHFNKSLTLKRIHMIQSIKKNISRPRLVGLGALVLLVFAIFSCEEKVLADLKNAAKQSMLVTEYPVEVQQTIDKLKARDPNAEFRVYGLVKSSDVTQFEEHEDQQVGYVAVEGDPDFSGYAIISNSKVKKVAGYLTERKLEDDIYLIVEDAAQPLNGMPEFYKFIASEIKYPVEARQKGIEGRVFVSFTVDESGKLSDFKIIRGISPDCDKEAVRVLSMSPNWKPGMQSGIAVKSIYNMPVVFKLDQGENQANQQKLSKVIPDEVIEVPGKPLHEIVVSGQKPKGN